MKIIEVRDGFVKLESQKKVEISSFLELKGLEKRYVAQVIRTKNNGAGYNVYAKILFIYDGMLKKYDKTLPDNTAVISEFPFNVINNSFEYFNPIVVGKFISDKENILVDSNSFNNSTLVCIDSPENNNIIIRNLANQFKQTGKTVIIDMLGIINRDEKYVAGRDFKLPLNTESLKFMYEDCLYDATADSKSLIKEIFTDLVEYSNDVKFIPFATLKTIVDNMVEKSHIFKLLVFKNKLTKFDSSGYFASNITDAENLSKILNSDTVILDLSKLDNLFQNRYLSVILSELQNSETEANVLIEVSNSISKRNIKNLLYSDNIKTTFFTHSKFKYLSEMKPLFKNYLLENNSVNKNIFNLYSFFIDGMESNNYLIIGESTNNVPLISSVEKYDVEIKKLPQDSASEEIIDALGSDNVKTHSDKDVTVEDILSQYSLQETEPVEFQNDETDITTKQDDTEKDLEVVDLQNLVEESVSTGVPDGANIESEIIDVPTEELVENSSLETFASDELTEAKNIDESEDNISEDIDNNIQTDNSDNTELIQEDVSEDVALNIADEEIIEQKEEAIVEENDDVEIPQDLTLDFEEIEKEESQATDLNTSDDIFNEESAFETDTVLPPENQDFELGEFTELNEEDLNEEDILVELNDGEEITGVVTENTNNIVDLSDDIDKDIKEDVDKVFTTMKDDNISEADLDFIDTLNDLDSNGSENLVSEDEFFNQNDAETLQELSSDEEDGFLEPLEEVSDSHALEEEQDNAILEKRESSTPIVPIYDAEIPEEDMVASDEIEQGDTVMHAKYGSGVVEKMIKYGSKNLYSINFDNVGRRLLDPTLTEIKKA